MNDAVRRTTFGLLLLAACAPSQARSQYREDTSLAEVALSGKTPESIIILWPAFSYRLARLMIAKYNQPAVAGDHSLIWLDNGPWKRTVVYRNPPRDNVLGKNAGRLEQSVAYRVPADKLDALARFDGIIEADTKGGRLTARSDAESDNFLALNLADEVLNGRRTPKEASDFRRQVSRLRDAGKSSPYLEGLLFVRGDQFTNPERPD